MKILILEDEPMLLHFLEGVFLGRPHDVRAFFSATRALGGPPGLATRRAPLRPGHGQGAGEDLAWILPRVRVGLGHVARVILMSGEPPRLARACRAADDVLLKPFTVDELVSVVERTR